MEQECMLEKQKQQLNLNLNNNQSTGGGNKTHMEASFVTPQKKIISIYFHPKSSLLTEGGI